MSYRFIKSHESDFEVQVMCQALEVSRSGYYAWRRRGETTTQERRETALRQHIQTIFDNSQGTYGSPRVYAELKAHGIACSRDHVAHIERHVVDVHHTAHRAEAIG